MALTAIEIQARFRERHPERVRAWDQRYKAGHRDELAERQRRYVAENHAVVQLGRKPRVAAYREKTDALKRASGCLDCGATEDLQFHHRDPATKRFSIAQGHGYSEENQDAELAKTDVVCASCHRVRHGKQR